MEQGKKIGKKVIRLQLLLCSEPGVHRNLEIPLFGFEDLNLPKGSGMCSV